MQIRLQILTESLKGLRYKDDKKKIKQKDAAELLKPPGSGA